MDDLRRTALRDPPGSQPLILGDMRGFMRRRRLYGRYFR
jgi:hypothetical protein